MKFKTIWEVVKTIWQLSDDLNRPSHPKQMQQEDVGSADKRHGKGRK